MAALQSLASASPVAQHLQHLPRCFSGSGSWAVNKSSFSLFHGQSLYLPRLRSPLIRRKLQASGLVTMMVKPSIQFVQGADEQTVPDVRLTKSRDGSNGMAIFTFDEPSVFDSSAEVGDITGFLHD
ncbi:hypothetical protein OIU79_016844 [Salix purpurea]|uniref:Photosystem II reaction center Psb28 protein n=1 Tax=Salix purpurea TaxID=77065 RepID=A0A9Q0SRZ3_SALPP|nr:hypothetical protein OIU79_016844 [Salix purpurea]